MSYEQIKRAYTHLYKLVFIVSYQSKRLYRTYCLKESLRHLLKLKDVDEAESELKRWLWRASHSRIPAVHIGKYAFAHCTSLENVVIPKKVTEITDLIWWR